MKIKIKSKYTVVTCILQRLLHIYVKFCNCYYLVSLQMSKLSSQLLCLCSIQHDWTVSSGLGWEGLRHIRKSLKVVRFISRHASNFQRMVMIMCVCLTKYVDLLLYYLICPVFLFLNFYLKHRHMSDLTCLKNKFREY